jgi:hypothetical protein
MQEFASAEAIHVCVGEQAEGLFPYLLTARSPSRRVTKDRTTDAIVAFPFLSSGGVPFQFRT